MSATISATWWRACRLVGRLCEIEHPGHDRLKLVELLPDHAHVRAPGVALGKVEAHSAVEKLEHRERVADLVGDLGGEEPEGRQALVLAERLLAHEDAGVEPRILQRHGAKAREGAAEALLVIVEDRLPVREDDQHAHHLALEEHAAWR